MNMHFSAGLYIKDFLKEQSENSALKLIEYAKLNELADDDIIVLAQGLADSGERITNIRNIAYCDISSTGGPSSLSTLICPLFLKLMGSYVIKLAVPGRPAGGIDVLAQIKGYQTNLSLLKINDFVSDSQYVHFLADNTFAPLDAKLFEFRKRNNALDIRGFVIASLLSKKIAVGLKKIGLDIRVSSFGNFGKSVNEAVINAGRFNAIAKMFGISSKCFITNGEIPQQPYIGRGESILALKRIFDGKADDQLKRHLGDCYAMASSFFDSHPVEIPTSFLQETFYQNIVTQGGSIDHFNKLSEEIEEQNKYSIVSTKTGILFVNLNKIRQAIVKIQNQIYDTLFPDPCGVIMKSVSGQYIEKGTIICSFRCIDQDKHNFEDMLTDAFGVLTESNQVEIIV